VPEENATTSTSIAPPVANSSRQRRHKRHSQKRMIYGFIFSHEEMVDWGRQHFGETDNKDVLWGYVRRSMGPLFDRCHALWRRTTSHIVTGPRRDDAVKWCLCLADNISSATKTPPPREIINQIKEALEITQEPEWHRFDGD